MFGDRRKVMSKKEAREQLSVGVNILADTVSSTLGPKGRNVICQRIYNKSRVTKDGVTVASEFFLEDPVQDIGAQLIKEASQKTAEEAGDGTTTSTIIARALFNMGINYINENDSHNPVDYNSGITKGVEEIVAKIKGEAIEVKPDTKELEHVATISANNDVELGQIVASAVSSVGEEGKVVMETSKTAKTYYESIKGTVIEQGYMDPVFVTDASSEELVLNNPLIVSSNFKFHNMEDIHGLVSVAYQKDRDMLIIAEELDKEALAFVAENVARGKIKMAVVRPPSVSNMRKFMLEDIAVITGGTFRDTTKGHSSKKFFDKYFGSAEKVIVNRKQTVILGGAGTEQSKENRIKAIKENIGNSDKGIDGRHKERLSKMFSGVATIYIGAKSEVEQKEKKDRVEDAILATQSALAEGIIKGGGQFLLFCSPDESEFINEDEARGYLSVFTVCSQPFNTIIKNAGKEPNSIVDMMLPTMDSNPEQGYNAKTDTYVPNLMGAGIIDPAKVTRSAIENAASVAKTLLTTEAVIYYANGHNPESVHQDPGNVR